jgi:hypothetical protein
VCDPIGINTLLATPLGKKKNKIQSTSKRSDDDKTKEKGNHTDPFNPKNINHPSSIEEIPDDLCQKIEAKFAANLKAFLENCTKDRHDKVTQYREPNFGDSIASTSATPKVKVDEKVDDPYPTHVDYAKILQNHKTVNDNNLMTAVNMIMSRFDRLEGKTIYYVDLSVDELDSKQPKYGMPYNFYDNQSLYAAANKAKLASSAIKTDKGQFRRCWHIYANSHRCSKFGS